jgi:Kdo2-lipid IVA lauroyltransferase/acyltransferase
MSKPLIKRWSKAFRHGLAYLALRLFQSLITSLGHGSRRKLALALGHRLYLLPGPRRLVTQHLQFALGDRLTPRQLDAIARQNFLHMAESLTELLWWMRHPARELNLYIAIEGEQEIIKALALGKGVIGLTSHLGNWELLGGYISNFVVPISVIAEPIFDARVNQILIDARTHLGVNTIYRRESGKSLLRVLRSNGFVGMLADQDIPTSESTFVNFFGKSALTPVGPASLSLHTGASIVPMFIHRLPDGSHQIVVEKALEYTKTGDQQKDIHDLTQLWSDVVERFISQTPEQWVWLHDRFKTRPETTP